MSATPGPYELGQTGGEVVEQVIRPTGLVDPKVVVKPTQGQIDDLIHEIRLREERGERVLVTTLTKKMAEDLTDYLLEKRRPRPLHAPDVDTLKRVELLRQLRLGDYDVLVGINPLREGLDLPEVSLVAILDADKEGFLRSTTSLIQTIGRAMKCFRRSAHVRRLDHRLDAQRDRGDGAAPRKADRLQHRARHRPATAAQEDRRHPRPGPRKIRRRAAMGRSGMPRPPMPLWPNGRASRACRMGAAAEAHRRFDRPASGAAARELKFELAGRPC